MDKIKKPVILTGDRPTGKLHIGHYVGSLKNRVRLQNTHNQTILVADLQALTDNADNPDKVRSSIVDVVIDYLSVGIDPNKTKIALQSAIPELSELSMLYLNHVTVSRLERNPTIKNEIVMREYERDIPAGFLMYPVAQAADITAFKAEYVPVGDDQLPMIEQANEIVRKVNRMSGSDILPETKAIISQIGRLPGTDGRKASKSLGNAINLSDGEEEISKKVMSMFTDPNHLRVSDPGKVEGNVVFAHLDAFDPDVNQVMELKEYYQKGGLGDMVLKRRLNSILQDVLRPFRERRMELEKNKDFIVEILKKGTYESRDKVALTLSEVKTAFGVPKMF